VLRQVEKAKNKGTCIADVKKALSMEKGDVGRAINELHSDERIIYLGVRNSHATGRPAKHYRVRRFMEGLFR
jgi:hypothetical protein